MVESTNSKNVFLLYVHAYIHCIHDHIQVTNSLSVKAFFQQPAFLRFSRAKWARRWLNGVIHTENIISNVTGNAGTMFSLLPYHA